MIFSLISPWLKRLIVAGRGSLGLITSLLSELGINIGKASVFSSSDGIEPRVCRVAERPSRADEMLLPRLEPGFFTRALPARLESKPGGGRLES